MAGLLRHAFIPAALGGPAHARAAKRGLPLAIAVSTAAHALVAGFVVLPVPPAPAPRVATSRSPSAMTVSLASRAAPVPARPARPIKPPSQKTKRPALPVRSAALPAAPVQSPPAAPAPEPAATAALAPSARFAGLFAPVIQSSLGRSAWGRTSVPRPAPPVDPQVLREQAALALQMSVQSRLSALAENLRSAGHDARCEVVVDTERRVAQVECAQPSDQAAPWAYLQGLLVAGAVAPEATSRQCFKLAEQQLSMGPCPVAPPTP